MERRAPPQSASDDPVLDAEVEHAIAPYRDLLPPDMLEVLRATLAEPYTEHPAWQQILYYLTEHQRVINASAEVPIHPDTHGVTEEERPMVANIRRRPGR